MKRSMTMIAATATACGLIAAPALGAEEPKPKQIANQQCKAEKDAMGNKAFKELYGKRAMQRCKRSNSGEAEEAIANASQECDAEREALGEEQFAEQYGTNKNGKNAFGKCVSEKARAEAEDDAEATDNAAKQCKAERMESGDEAFAEQYGTNKNGKNAFGKCVSEHAEAEDEETDEEEPAPTV